MSKQGVFDAIERLDPVLPQVQAMAAAEVALRRVLEPGAPNTERAYSQQRKRWAAWCESHGLEALPIDAPALVTYLEEMSASGKSPRTVRLALAALSSIDRAARITPTDKTPAPIRSSAIVRRWLKSWSRSVRDRKPRKAPAVTRASLLTIVRHMHTVRHVRGHSARAVEMQRMRDRALFLVGWLGCLRRSELAALTRGCLVETEKGLEIAIAGSKTDQAGEGDSVLVYRQQSTELCALEAWRVWLMALELTSKGGELSAFPRITAGGELGGPLTPEAVGEIIKRRASAAGLNALGHSLRRGFASEAAEQRKPEADLMRHGRWTDSKTVREYIERADKWKLNPTEGIT